MSDKIIVLDQLVPSAGSTYTLLDDLYLRGSFRIVKNESERDTLALSNVIKLGSLVKCQESGIYWRASNISVTEDMFGDLVTAVDWEEFKFSSNSQQDLFKLCRYLFTVDLATVMEGKGIETVVNLQCYSFFMFNLRLSLPGKLEIFSSADRTDRNPYTFIGRYDHLIDSGESFVSRKGEDSFVLKTSAYNILVNEDVEPTTNFYFRLTKNSKYTEFNKYDQTMATVAFDYIPLEV